MNPFQTLRVLKKGAFTNFRARKTAPILALLYYFIIPEATSTKYRGKRIYFLYKIPMLCEIRAKNILKYKNSILTKG
jgi:hypothetical protein